MKYKKILFFVLVIIIIYLIYFFYHGKTISYIALGDSFALGENPYGEVGYSYADYLRDDLSKNKNIKLYTKEFTKKNYYIQDLYEDIIFNKKILIDGKTLSLKSTLRDANLITISIGKDDLFSKISFQQSKNISDDDIVDNISHEMNLLIKEIMKYNSNIILVGYYNLFYDKNDSKIFEKLNEEYKSIAKKHGITYIDIYNKMNYDNLSNPNSYYPNVEGYRFIESEIMKSFK